VHTLCRKSTS